MRSGSLALTIGALAFAVAAPSAGHEEQEKYTVVPIVLPADPDCLPGFWRATTARRLNERGEVVGDDICVIATGDTAAPAVIGGSDAFRWHRALGATMLPALSANSRETYARDINESGTAIGWEDRGDFTFVAPVWPRAGGVSLAIEPEDCAEFGAFAIGDGINDHGDVLAIDDRVDASGVCQFGVWVLKLASGEEILGPASGRGFQLNNNRVGVGQSSNRAVRWSPTSGETVLYDDPTFQSAAIAWSVNDRDEAVGPISRFDQTGCISVQTAAFWAASGQQTLLNPLRGDASTWAYSINNHSEVVGYSYSEAQGCDEPDVAQFRAVVWEGQRAVDLNSLVPQRFAREFKLSIAAAINDRGQILVRGVRRGEPKMPCPRIDFDPVTGENFYNDSVFCQSVYAFLLTPKRERR
jgi:uncharacterized membrane protein